MDHLYKILIGTQHMVDASKKSIYIKKYLKAVEKREIVQKSVKGTPGPFGIYKQKGNVKKTKKSRYSRKNPKRNANVGKVKKAIAVGGKVTKPKTTDKIASKPKATEKCPRNRKPGGKGRRPLSVALIQKVAE
ncbi:hypothetical protein CDAR_314861 [Caerostris darwini]|uniref:Uncharacterized protein n=1 Tax=Caerostris darwini TaxID=1538125 RepID=A0AAV4TQB5_9ARAC|nr:hypothetical protein CDAR_314861 [Caerostris darwini]